MSSVLAKQGVIVMAFSENRKLSHDNTVHTTYVNNITCSAICPLKSNGCYGEAGPIGIIARRLNNNENTADEITEQEAIGIRMLPHMGVLRLHTYGDVKGRDNIRKLSAAVLDWSR